VTASLVADPWETCVAGDLACVRTIESESGLSGRIDGGRATKGPDSFGFDQMVANGSRGVRELKILVSAVQSRPCPPANLFPNQSLRAQSRMVRSRSRTETVSELC
jgi:hypothetical protein